MKFNCKCTLILAMVGINGCLLWYLRELNAMQRTVNLLEGIIRQFSTIKCNNPTLLGKRFDHPGFELCDAGFFHRLYTECKIHVVGNVDSFIFEHDFMRAKRKNNCNVHVYNKKKLTMPDDAYHFVQSNISLEAGANKLSLKNHFQANNYQIKFLVFKVDIGSEEGMHLVSTQELGLQPCNLLITVKGTVAELQEFITKMKFRAYYLFAVRRWNNSVTFHTTDKNSTSRYKYNLSFVKTYCILESRGGYSYKKNWVEI